jgi:hypothetical protein
VLRRLKSALTNATAPLAIIAAAVLIVAAVLFLFRYEVAVTADGIVRLNRITGYVAQCHRAILPVQETVCR